MKEFITICNVCNSKEIRVDGGGVACCKKCGSYDITPLALPR